MAFVQTENDPNQPTQAPNASMAQMPQTSTGTGAGATPGGPQGSTAVPNTTQAPPVQDLQAYLAANAPQSVQMGQNIAGNLNTQVGQVTGDINAAQSDVNAQVNASNVAPNPDLINQAASNPAEFVKDPNNVTAFQGQANATYAGPSSFESTPYDQTLTTEITNAQQNAPDINKPGGLEQLVRGQETNPTVGMQNLDTLLLQQNPEAMAPIQGALPQFGNLTNYLQNVRTGTNADIQKAISNNQAVKSNVASKFTGEGGVVPTWENSLQNSLTEAGKNRATQGNEINDLTKAINANDLSGLSPAQLTKLGITPQEVSDYQQQIYQIKNTLNPNYVAPNLSNYYTPGQISPIAPSLANVATSEDYAKNAALEQLLGTGYSPYLSDANASQSGQLGSPTNPTFNQDLFKYEPINKPATPTVPTVPAVPSSPVTVVPTNPPAPLPTETPGVTIPYGPGESPGHGPVYGYGSPYPGIF